MRRLHRGDLSAPVLAIIVTIGIIAAGLVLMAWFWWFAPQAGKAGTLQILGTPSIVLDKVSNRWVVYISVRNVGNDPITITGVVVKGVSMDKEGTGWIKTDATYTDTLSSGQSGIIIAKNDTRLLAIETTEYSVPCIIQTNYGVFTVNLAVVRPS
jgi:hypothetical protein